MKITLRRVAGLVLTAIVGASVASGQTPSLSRVMREKLEHSKAILGAVVMSDWTTLDRESRALARAAKDPSWTAQLNAPEYLRQSDAFERALRDLIAASARRDLSAASKAEVSLTTSCVGCHQYVAGKRIAKKVEGGK
jgi:cytochrome c553